MNTSVSVSYISRKKFMELTFGRSEDKKLMQQDRVGWGQPEVENFQPL